MPESERSALFAPQAGRSWREWTNGPRRLAREIPRTSASGPGSSRCPPWLGREAAATGRRDRAVLLQVATALGDDGVRARGLGGDRLVRALRVGPSVPRRPAHRGRRSAARRPCGWAHTATRGTARRLRLALHARRCWLRLGLRLRLRVGPRPGDQTFVGQLSADPVDAVGWEPRDAGDLARRLLCRRSSSNRATPRAGCRPGPERRAASPAAAREQTKQRQPSSVFDQPFGRGGTSWPGAKRTWTSQLPHLHSALIWPTSRSIGDTPRDTYRGTGSALRIAGRCKRLIHPMRSRRGLEALDRRHGVAVVPAEPDRGQLSLAREAGRPGTSDLPAGGYVLRREQLWPRSGATREPMRRGAERPRAKASAETTRQSGAVSRTGTVAESTVPPRPCRGRLPPP